jgi:hypothetical protein
MIINDLCSRVHYSLRNQWSASEYISSELKIRLVKALVIPQFLFGDVLLRMADSTGLRKLEVAFNNCVRFVNGFRRYDLVSEYCRNVLGCSLSKYYELRACCMLKASSFNLKCEVFFLQSSVFFSLNFFK